MSEETLEPVLYSYGKNNNTLPECVSIVSSTNEDGVSWGAISAIWSQDGAVVLSEVKSNVNYLKKIQTFDSASEIYPASGFLITKVDDFGQYETPKTIKQVMLGADIPT